MCKRARPSEGLGCAVLGVEVLQRTSRIQRRGGDSGTLPSEEDERTGGGSGESNSTTPRIMWAHWTPGAVPKILKWNSYRPKIAGV